MTGRHWRGNRYPDRNESPIADHDGIVGTPMAIAVWSAERLLLSGRAMVGRGLRFNAFHFVKAANWTAMVENLSSGWGVGT
jgi:hypothetical protein